VEFTETLRLLQARFLRRPLAIGKDYKGLYILDKEVIQGVDLLSIERQSITHSKPRNACNKLSSICSNVARSVSSVSFNIWHKRLGHMSCNKTKTISDLNILQHNVNHFICEVCPKAKQHRLLFPTRKSVSHSAFELIHVDTWGPYHTKTHIGHRYFLTIVDDYTRATWTHLMITKDEAMSLIKSFVVMAKTQFGAVVKHQLS